MIGLAQGNYTHEAVYNALHAKAAPRVVSFQYDLLNANERKKKTLTTVESASISMSAFADIKRTAKFKLREDSDINYSSDRIQPFFRLLMPDGNYAEWSLGIFLLSTPKRTEQRGYIYRNVEAYDGLQVLLDDKFEDRYAVDLDDNYVTEVKAILTGAGISNINIVASTKTLPAAIEFEPGTTKYAAVNTLLSALNYIPIYVDVNGFYTSRPYVNPADRSVAYTYADDDLSVLFNGLTEEIDLFNVPNKFVCYTSDPDTESLRSVYTNSNVLSPLSTVGRGRTITDVRKVKNIADQTTLDEYTARIAFEASQVYGYVEMETALMPFHDINDVVRIEYSPLFIYEKFSETNWSISLAAGAKMKHKLRRVVTI